MSFHDLEIERKYLIKYPDTDFLRAIPGCRVFDITQTYLSDSMGRVRKRVSRSGTEYFHTVKNRVSGLTCLENERSISAEEYTGLLRLADPKRSAILKTRYCFLFDEQMFEVDVFPFWTDRALMEIELDFEEQEVRLPPFISVIKEVTYDPRYKNSALAGRVPVED